MGRRSMARRPAPDGSRSSAADGDRVSFGSVEFTLELIRS